MRDWRCGVSIPASDGEEAHGKSTTAALRSLKGKSKGAKVGMNDRGWRSDWVQTLLRR